MKNDIKAALALLCALFVCVSTAAQESTSAFNMLRLPLSSHTAALGGDNASLVEDAPAAGLANPAMLSAVSDNSFGLNFMTYADGGKLLGAEYVKAFGERHTAMATISYMGYGAMDETDAMGNVLGQFSPKDILVGAGYSYLLSDCWAGGATVKLLNASIADFHSTALAFDLGLNYFDADRDLSVSLLMRNVGAQLSTFDGRSERIPYSLQVGLSQGMAHMPVRLHITATDLTRWKDSDFFAEDGEKLGFGSKLLRHFVIGIDLLPSDVFYIAAGYNFRRAAELKAAGSSHLAGLSLGAGVNLKKIKFGASYARYHQACSSLMFNLGYAL